MCAVVYGFSFTCLHMVYVFDMLVCFWKYVCYFATYDCATTVALECIDRASSYYKKLWKIKTKLLFELFCERIHFSKEAFQFAANMQRKCMHTKTF